MRPGGRPLARRYLTSRTVVVPLRLNDELVSLARSAGRGDGVEEAEEAASA